MQCVSPLLAVRYFKQENGKDCIKILSQSCGLDYNDYSRRYGGDNLLFLPCGKCPACLSRKAKEWAVRCCMEAMNWKSNCFLTLTYDDEKLPSSGDVVKQDMVRFIKAIRNRGHQVRYYGCVERGDQFGRLHAHLILFNYFPADCKPWAKSQSGFMQYKSVEVDNCWNKGLAVCSEFHPFNAQYVAGYVVKKIIANDDDCCHIQSTRPGIGFAYFVKNIEKIYDTDNLVLNFGDHVFSVPRYFDKVADNLALDLTDIKVARKEKGSLIASQQMKDLGLFSVDWLHRYNEEVVMRNRHRKRRMF